MKSRKTFKGIPENLGEPQKELFLKGFKEKINLKEFL